jgi:hypothetical protein
MNPRRIGQLIRSVVPITDHDIEEILQEQTLSHRPFGQIAIAWGLCTPAHVWQAWARQPDHPTPHVNLDRLGVDAQSIGHLPQSLAYQCRAIPVRIFENLVIVAVTDLSNRPVLEQHFQSTGEQLALVLASAEQIDQALAQYYPIKSKEVA